MESNQRKLSNKTTSTSLPSRKSFHSELSRYAFGEQAEELACNYLCLSGYRILRRNYRAHYPGKEIDIVAVNARASYLAFVEVKSSRSSVLTAIANITPTKLRHLKQALSWYLLQSPTDMHYRLEYIGLQAQANCRYRLEHLILDMV